MGSILLFIGVVAACGLMLWGSYKLEPHWVSKDGERLICYGQPISRLGEAQGRWRELRVTATRDGSVEVRPRRGTLVTDRYSGNSAASIGGMAGGLAGTLLKRRGNRASQWKVLGQNPNPPKRRVMFLLHGSGDPDLPEMLAIKMPANSRAVPVLEAMATNKTPALQRAE